jgi:hypothetical protein
MSFPHGSGGAGGDEAQPSWESLKTLAKSRHVGATTPKFAALGGSPDSPQAKVPVRELRRTMDRVPKLYEVQSPSKLKKRADYDTDSDDEGTQPKRKTRSPQAGQQLQVQTAFPAASPTKSTTFASPMTVSPSKVAITRGRSFRAQQQLEAMKGPLTPSNKTEMENGTLLEQSLRAVAAETIAKGDLTVDALEGALEKSGATAKLRAMTNEEAKRDRLERSMYELAEIPPAVAGHLKRVVWSLPDRDKAEEHYKASLLKQADGSPFPLSAYTGRNCFNSGVCKMAALCDPLGEGTKSEVCPCPVTAVRVRVRERKLLCVRSDLAAVSPTAARHAWSAVFQVFQVSKVCGLVVLHSVGGIVSKRLAVS